MTETIKFLATLTDTELNAAMKQVKGSDEVKARALKEINDYKYAKETLAKWFNK